MRFARLVSAISMGLLEQIPIMGPVLGKILAEQDRSRLEDRLADLIERLSQIRAEPMEDERVLVSALHLAQAEITSHLQAKARPRNRFLYLAGNHFASFERTFEIASQHGFLWRSYYRRTGGAINRVNCIAVGDVIALGYRIQGNKFRLLLPLVVTEGNPETRPIDTDQFRDRDYGPFVWAGTKLEDILELDYGVDPVFKKFTGLAVKPLLTDVTSEVLRGTFDSPGANAL